MNTVGTDGRTQYYRLSTAAVLDALRSHKMGLTNAEAERRHHDEGANILPTLSSSSPITPFFKATLHPLVVGLLLGSLLAVANQESGLALALCGVTIVTIALRSALFVPWSPRVSLPPLAEHARTIRNGQIHRIETSKLVLGDIIQLSVGDIVPADVRLLTAEDLTTDESLLFGSAHKVKKTSQSIRAEVALNERTNLAWMGTKVKSGQAAAIVVAISAQTELGRIILLTRAASAAKAQINIRWSPAWLIALGIATFVAVGGWLAGLTTSGLLATLAVITLGLLPSGYVIAQTIGLWRMRPRAGIHLGMLNRLSSVDTLITQEKSVARFKAFGLHTIQTGQNGHKQTIAGLNDETLIKQLTSGKMTYGLLATEEKLRLVRVAQLAGHRVAIIAHSLSDLPAQAQADAYVTNDNGNASLFNAAQAAASLSAGIRQVALRCSATSTVLALLGIVGWWLWRIPVAINPALLLTFSVVFVPLVATVMSLNTRRNLLSEIAIRSCVAASLAYIAFIALFLSRSIDPSFIDPINPLVRSGAMMAFVTLTACLGVDLGFGDSHARRRSSVVTACLGACLLLAMVYLAPLQQLFGGNGLELSDWLIIIITSVVYGLFVWLQHHARHHSRHTVIDLHHQTYGHQAAPRF